MICNNCGAEVGTSNFCTNCGKKMAVENSIQINSLQEFYEQYASKKTKSWVLWYLVINFVSPIISIVSLINGNLIELVHIVVLLGIGFVILSSKNWIAALCGVIYGSILFILNLILFQSTTNVVYVIVGTMSMIKLYKLKEAYNQYKLSAILPKEEI